MRNTYLTLSLVLFGGALIALPAQAQPFYPYPNGTGGIDWINQERLMNPASNIALPGTMQTWFNPVTGRLEYFYIDITGRPRGSVSHIDPFTGGVGSIAYSKQSGPDAESTTGKRLSNRGMHKPIPGRLPGTYPGKMPTDGPKYPIKPIRPAISPSRTSGLNQSFGVQRGSSLKPPTKAPTIKSPLQ